MEPNNHDTIAAAAGSRAANLLALASLAGLGLVAYGNGFQAPFVFDGDRLIYAFSADKFWPWQLDFQNSRPLGMLSFSLNYAWGKDAVWGYHAANLVIHVIAGWLLYGVVRRTLARPPLANRHARWLAFAAAAIWLVHPLQTESVTYLVQRFESLMGLFYLLTLYCFVRALDSDRPGVWYAASVVACALGMGTKEVTVSAPLVVLWYDRALVASCWREIWRTRWKYYAALAGTWILLAFLMMRPDALYESRGMLKVDGVTPLGYALSQPGIIVHYLKLSFWPSGLCLDYEWPMAKGWLEIVPPGLLIVALLAATIWCIFRHPAWGFLGGSFFLILAPTSSVAPIADLAVEHRMYLALAPLVVLVLVLGYEAWRALVARLPAGAKSPSKLPAVAAAVLLLAMVAALGTRTILRNRDYGNEIRLWQATTRIAPDNARAYRNLASASYNGGQLDQVLVAASEAIRLNPGYAHAYYLRGLAHQRLGHPELALAEFSKAIALKPDFVKAYFNRAHVYSSAMQFEPAVQDMTEVIRRKPRDLEALRRRAALYVAMGRYDKAAADYTQAIELKGNDALLYLSRAQACALDHQYLAASRDFDRALQIESSNVSVLNGSAWLLATCPDEKVRSPQLAFRRATAACELTRWRDPACLDTLAAACAERGDFNAAVNWATRAIDLKPHDEPFRRDVQPRLDLYRAGAPYRDEPAADSPPAQLPEPPPQSE